MKLQKNLYSAKYIYHYTTRERAQQILKEHRVRCFEDQFTFFTASHADAAKVCRNVMKEGAFYIDNSLCLRQRTGTDFSDYVILKIQCPAGTEFYHLTVEHEQDTFCAYDYSLMHRGDLYFQKAKILPLDAPAFTSCKKAVSRAAVLGGACLLLGAMWTASAYASRARWLDAGNYETAWTNNPIIISANGTNKEIYNITTAEQLAGLSYLANGGDLNGTGFNATGKIFRIQDNIDLSSKEWTSIPASFLGTIDGVHIIITLAQGDVFMEGSPSLEGIVIRYAEEDTPVPGPVEEAEEVEEVEEVPYSCPHVGEEVMISEATPETDALGAEKCTLCGEILEYYPVPGSACASFLQSTADAIRHTKADKVIVDTELWTCLDKRITDALSEHRDVSLTINYKYQGTKYTVTIPAGTDASELLDENGYCGFRYLDLLYNGSALNG